MVSLHKNALIQNNGDIGIQVRLLSSVGLDNTPQGTLTTVQGHNIIGILIQEGSHLQFNGAALVQGNGFECPEESPISCGGILASENSTVEFQGAGTISNNHGVGILVEQGTNLHLGGGATISNNSGDGVHLRKTSTGDFKTVPGSGFANNTITGNGGASVFCEEGSFVVGSLAGLSNVKCPQE